MSFREGSARSGSAVLEGSPEVGIGDESVASNGRRRSRPEVSKRVPHQSFAYGAPSETKAVSKANSGNKQQSKSAGSPTQDSLVGSEVQEISTEAAPAVPASSRYAALKAKRQQKASNGSISGLVSHPSPARRSARLSSIASGSQDADAVARRKELDEMNEIDEDAADESDDEHGKARKSSVPPPTISTQQQHQPHQLHSHSFWDNTSASQSRGDGQALSSYFVRAPGKSMSPVPRDQRSSAPRTMMQSSLLRGAQRPGHDPLSPRHEREISVRSSDAGDSRSYASEEAFVRRGDVDDDDDRETTPPARSQYQPTRSWLANLSPWRRPDATSTSVNGSVSRLDAADLGQSPAANQRRKPRMSNDKTYRPPVNGEEDDSDELSEGGRRRVKRRKSDDKSARGGRDDNRIWANGKRRKGRRSQGGEDGVEAEEDSRDADFLVGGIQAQARSTPLSGPASSSTLKAVAAAVTGLAVLGSVMPSQNSLSRSDGSTIAPTTSAPLLGGIFGRRKTFQPPTAPPSDFDSFVSRLLSLEKTVGVLSSTSTSLTESHEQLARQVGALEMSSKEAQTLLGRLEEESKTAQRKVDGKFRALEGVSARLQEQVERLEARAASESRTTKDSDRLKAIEARLDQIRGDLKQNNEQLAKVAANAREAQSIAKAAGDALQPLLAANLPAQMPVKIDQRTGKPKIEPWFYESLKGIVGSGSPTQEGVAPMSWESFRQSHETALRALIAEESSSLVDRRQRSTDGHAILSRSDFLELLKAEIEAMKATLEKSFNENAQGMQSDILPKVRTQQTMYEESGSWSKSRTGPRGAGSSAAGDAAWQDLPALSQLRSKDGSDPRRSILALVDAALEAYSADKINKADFALYSAGGRVIPSMTSPTFEVTAQDPRSSAGTVSGGSWLSRLPGFSSVATSSSNSVAARLRSRSPVVALHHDNAPGMCWPFAGQSGQLGIQLARKAIVTDITIEHPLSSLTFGDSSSAPREIAVFGLIEREEDRQRVADWQRQEQAKREEAESEEGGSGGGDMEIISAPPDRNFMHLATFTYDASAAQRRSIQTFSASAEARALRVPVSVVQVKVLSNHGEPSYTCLYRVRVHGEAWKEDAEGMSSSDA